MRKLSLFFAIIIALSSCHQFRYIYSASKPNTPMLQQKNDSRLNASVSIGASVGGVEDSCKNIGYDIQAAYALTNHFGIMASVYRRKEVDVYGTEVNHDTIPFPFSYVSYKRRFNEIGVGYFHNIAGSKWHFSAYTGIGLGDIHIADTGRSYTGTYRHNFSTQVVKYFVQPGINYKNILDFSYRISYLQYNKVKSDYSTHEQDVLKLSGLGSGGFLLSEPSVTFQIPIQSWLSIESTTSLVIHSHDRTIRFWNLSAGITLNPTDALRKKQND